MNTKPVFPRQPIGTRIAAAAISTVIAFGLFSGITGAFQREGTPLERLAVAERACADRAFASERASCVQTWLVAARLPRVASR